MAAHRREPPEERNEENRGKKTTATTSYSTEARRLVAARVVTNYSYLRENCPLLPQTGRLARYHILQGAADQIRLLRHENEFLQWRITASWEAQGSMGTRLQGQVSAEDPGPRDVREQKDVRTRPKTLLRSEDQPPLLQDKVVQDASGGGGDVLQIVEVRGGCQWPVTSTHQAQSRKQFKSPERADDLAKQKVVRAKAWGGGTSGDKQKVTGANAWGGETSGNKQGDECLEIKVVWGGTIENPVPIVSHPRPRRSESPPLPGRSWVATPIGRKIQLGSSTLQRIRTTPTNQTSMVPTAFNIPTKSLGVPRGNNVSPMDLSNRNPPLQEMLRESLMTAEPPPLMPIERWPACPPPSRSQGSFEKPPTHGIAQILKSSDVIEKARPATHDTMMDGVEDEVLVNVPVIRENNKDIGVETIPTTRNGLWSPAEDIMWIDSPPLVIDLEATPMRDPEPMIPLTTTSTSIRGTSPSRAVLRIAKWVGELGDNSVNHQEMDDNINEEVQGEKIDSVKGSTNSAEGIKPILDTGGQEVENENIQAQHREIGDNEMWVDEEETVTTSEATPETIIYADRESEETRPTWMSEASTREEVEEELDVGGPETVSHEVSGLTWIHESSTEEYVEPVDKKEMLKALFEDQQDETKDLKTLKTKPVTIPQWPRHIASHHGEVEDSEVLSDWPNSPTDQSPPVGSILESTWIEVVPNGDATEMSHLTAREDNEPKIETPPSQDVLKDEIISDDEIARTIDRNSEGEGGGKVEEIGEEDEEGRMKTTKVKDAYVAIRKLKIRGWKIREKTSKQKRKKKTTKWMFEKDREDRDWKPPRSRRKKMKAPPRIKLIRRRPISEDEEETEPSYRQPLQKRIWRGTNLRHQSEVITFYKTLHKKRIKEGKRRQRKRRREEEQGVYGGFVTTTVPMTERAGRSPNPGRQYCLRKSDSEVWEAEQRGGRADGPEQREGLEVNLEATQGEEQEVCHMEGRGPDQDTVGVDTEVAVGQDCEEKSGTKQSPSTKKEISSRGEKGAQEEDVSEGETAGADSARGCSGEGEYPRRGGRTAEEGEIVEETKADEFNRPSAAVTPSGASTPTAPIIGVQDLLRKWAEGGVHGLACEVRVRSAEEPPRPLDQEMSRGRSMR